MRTGAQSGKVFATAMYRNSLGHSIKNLWVHWDRKNKNKKQNVQVLREREKGKAIVSWMWGKGENDKKCLQFAHRILLIIYPNYQSVFNFLKRSIHLFSVHSSMYIRTDFMTKRWDSSAKTRLKLSFWMFINCKLFICLTSWTNG